MTREAYDPNGLRRVPPVAEALEEAYDALDVAHIAANRDLRPEQRQALNAALAAARAALEVPLLPGDEEHKRCISEFGPHQFHGQQPESGYRNCDELIDAMGQGPGDPDAPDPDYGTPHYPKPDIWEGP